MTPVELDMIPLEDQNASNQIFIFFLDRSGSMDGDKMEMAKDALKLFIQSLPKGAMFEIVSFGSNFEVSSKDKRGYVNDDQTKEKIYEEIDSYTASFGGTNILSPMKYIIDEYL